MSLHSNGVLRLFVVHTHNSPPSHRSPPASIPSEKWMTHTQPAHDPDDRSRALSARPTPSLERMHLETALRAAVVAPQLAVVLGDLEQQQPPNPATAARAPTRNTFCTRGMPRGTSWARDDTHAQPGRRDPDHTRARRCTKPVRRQTRSSWRWPFELRCSARAARESRTTLRVPAREMGRRTGHAEQRAASAEPSKSGYCIGLRYARIEKTDP